MKDILKRIVIGLVCVLFLFYLGYLFVGQQVILQTGFAQRNILYYIVLAAALIYVLIFFSIYPFYFKISKVSLFVLGLALIVLGDGVLLNDITKQIFVADLIKILGVVFTLLAFTDFFVTSKVKKQHQDSKVEIIEI
ncbi:MAG: hypothetical protein WCO66_00305 [Candidatus Absconditabacteria bacterium]